MSAAAEAFRRFPHEGGAARFERLRSGHINETFLVETDAGTKYILQRINRSVFPNVGAIMRNLAAVGAFLRQRGESERGMIRFLETADGRNWFDDGAGGAWRCYRFVDNSLCLLRPRSAEDFAESARAFGGFVHALRDFPAESLEETIENFHNTPDRYDRLRAAVRDDVCGRVRETGTELDFCLEREARACQLQRMRERGELPLRVTHNDTKFSNVLLDADSGRALCVIDLDTVMPGLSAYDFGDAIRAGASSAAEDEAEPGRDVLDLGLFRAFTRGWLEACPSLTEAERGALAPGAYTMTMECGVRFLTDYLQGDRYFAVDREGHNLARARAQFRLALDMEKHWDEMCGIVDEERRRTAP